MVPTEHIKSEIAAYLMGGLTEARNRQIEAHAASCEKCRQALSKARAKQARQKREALKKASPDPLPNLFLARQGKDAGLDTKPFRMTWILVGLLMVGGLIYGLVRTSGLKRRIARVNSMAPEAGVALSSANPMGVAAPPAQVAASVQTQSPAKPEPPKPVVAAPLPVPMRPVLLQVQEEWKGADSAIKEPRLMVVRSAEAWSKLWSEMQPAEALPSVDFEKQVVIGVFAGERPTGSSLAWGRIMESQDDVSAPYRVVSSEVAISSATAPSHPYLLAAIPRIAKRIRISEREE